jgi:hypothetical protein
MAMLVAHMKEKRDGALAVGNSRNDTTWEN